MDAILNVKFRTILAVMMEINISLVFAVIMDQLILCLIKRLKRLIKMLFK